MISDLLRNKLRRLRRRVFEAAGSDRYSRPSLTGIDRKLEKHLGFDGGFFVEAGGNDGYTQSNTYYFEAMRGWTGILIEPIPELALECAQNRRNSVVVQAALVPEGFANRTIAIDDAGLMSAVAGAFGDANARRRHVASGLEVQDLAARHTIEVPARTLSSVLDEHAQGREVDLLSLDVEGFEVEVLGGLNWDRHAPRFICIEARPAADVEALLAMRYNLIESMTDLGTHRDLLFERR
jgi:FkbM family methyltransferase